MGICGDMWGYVGRCGEMWGDVGRWRTWSLDAIRVVSDMSSDSTVAHTRGWRTHEGGEHEGGKDEESEDRQCERCVPRCI